MRTAIGLALLALVALAGCSSPPHQVDWRAEGLQIRGFPDPYGKLMIRHVRVHERPETSGAPGERYPVDESAVARVLGEALQGIGLFQEVQWTWKADESRARRPGMVLDVELEDAWLAHTGENDEATKAFFLWIFTGLPGLAVRDQVYELGYVFRVQITDGATGEVIVPWQPLGAPTSTACALNFHERTKGLLPYLLVNVCPPTRISIDEAQVIREIGPAALRPAIHSLFELFEQISFEPVSEVKFAPAPARELAGVESARLPERVAGPTTGLTLVLDVDPTRARDITGVRVGGRHADLPRGFEPPATGHRLIHLDDVLLPAEGKAAVELEVAGRSAPVRVGEIQAKPTGEIRPVLPAAPEDR